MSTKFHSIMLHTCIKEEICDINNLRKDLVWFMASKVIYLFTNGTRDMAENSLS